MTVHFLDDLERILTSDPANPPLAPISMCSQGSLGYMVGIMVVNVPLRTWGGTLGTWYLVGLVNLVSLQSLIQILRAVTLPVHKVQNGMARSLSGRSERPESGTEGSGGSS